MKNAISFLRFSSMRENLRHSLLRIANTAAEFAINVCNSKTLPTTTLRLVITLGFIGWLMPQIAFGQTGSCNGFLYFKSPDYASNTTYYNQWKGAIGETPDYKVNFESYSVGDNLKFLCIYDGCIKQLPK
jgi:hypothetical protein